MPSFVAIVQDAPKGGSTTNRKQKKPAIILEGDFNANCGPPTYEFLAHLKLYDPNIVGLLLKQQPCLVDVFVARWALGDAPVCHGAAAAVGCSCGGRRLSHIL